MASLPTTRYLTISSLYTIDGMHLNTIVSEYNKVISSFLPPSFHYVGTYACLASILLCEWLFVFVWDVLCARPLNVF